MFEAADVVEDDRGGGLRIGDAGDVRGHQDARMLPKRVTGRQRFFAEDVEGCSRKLPESSAGIRSSSTRWAPRPALTRPAPRGSAAKVRALRMPCVSSVSGNRQTSLARLGQELRQTGGAGECREAGDGFFPATRPGNRETQC